MSQKRIYSELESDFFSEIGSESKRYTRPNANFITKKNKKITEEIIEEVIEKMSPKRIF